MDVVGLKNNAVHPRSEMNMGNYGVCLLYARDLRSDVAAGALQSELVKTIKHMLLRIRRKHTHIHYTYNEPVDRAKVDLAVFGRDSRYISMLKLTRCPMFRSPHGNVLSMKCILIIKTFHFGSERALTFEQPRILCCLF